MSIPNTRENRRAPRLKLPAAYTLVRVRMTGRERYTLTGHIYDISRTGLRIELDDGLPHGAQVEFRAMLPGESHVSFEASARVVRMHEDSPERGPVRMGLEIERLDDADTIKLDRYLEHHGIAA